PGGEARRHHVTPGLDLFIELATRAERRYGQRAAAPAVSIPKPTHSRSRFMPDRSIHRTATIIALSLLAAPVSGQGKKKPAPAADTTARTPPGDPAPRGLHCRLAGPYRGGRTA